ncbi:MAG: hypothetical protein ACYTF1_04780 [Planctomycetota bacterium]|jgi:hypothetical protein
MTTNNQATEVLDDLLSTLESAAGGESGNGSIERISGDAIDAVLSSPKRTTKVTSLRDAPEVRAFREALVDGLIRIDTANQLLRLVNTIITRIMA